MIKEPFADALVWWLRSQGRDGLFGGTIQREDGSWEILEWQIKDIPKPSKDEIEKILSDYKGVESKAVNDQQAVADSVITKLKNAGFTEPEIDYLKKLVGK